MYSVSSLKKRKKKTEIVLEAFVHIWERRKKQDKFSSWMSRDVKHVENNNDVVQIEL